MLNNRERWHQRSNFLVVLFLISVPLKTKLDCKLEYNLRRNTT